MLWAVCNLCVWGWGRGRVLRLQAKRNRPKPQRIVFNARIYNIYANIRWKCIKPFITCNSNSDKSNSDNNHFSYPCEYAIEMNFKFYKTVRYLPFLVDFIRFLNGSELVWMHHGEWWMFQATGCWILNTIYIICIVVEQRIFTVHGRLMINDMMENNYGKM